MNFNRLHVLFMTVALFALVFLITEPKADWFDEFEQDAETVNEGHLVFPKKIPDQPVHHLHNRITITGKSLKTGWVLLSQCHEHLDPVPAVQIVFHPKRVRNLTVTESRNIGKAWVDGPSVQLEEVNKHARVCIDAETRALSRDDDDVYLLRNGPFMRRFLDGFYPMRLNLDVQFPSLQLRLISISPKPQPGFRLQHEDDKVLVETLFEGKLYTELRFAQ